MAQLLLLVKRTLRKDLLFLYYSLFCFISLFILFYLLDIKKPFLFFIIFLAVYIAVVEILFRVFYKILFGRFYQLVPKTPFKKMHIEPHPYLPYVFKKNFLFYNKYFPLTCPLNRDKGYRLGQLKTNNFRHLNGPKGDRDIEVPKPKDLIRINCLGSSASGSCVFYNNQTYSYPMELEKILKNAFPKINIEVNNCGQAGYTSAEMLIKFLLDTIDTEPNIVVIYQAYNDLQPSLTANFQSDYSHSRRNLGEVYYLYNLNSKIPYIPLASWNYMINNCFFLSQNIRSTLLSAITRKNADIRNDFKGLNTYKRNIKHLIDICKANNIHVVLSTYCHYLYPAIKNDEEHLKYREGLKLENEALKELALKCNVPLVDNDSLFPRQDKYFMDSIHFTPEGMHLLAKNISRLIIDYIKTLGLSSEG